MTTPILVCRECEKRPELCDCPASVKRRQPLVDLRKLVRDRERAA